MNEILYFYLLLINMLGFSLFGIDKRRAIRHRWRIRESVLLTVAALGGSIGCMTGMTFFHHKTLHQKFRLGLPTIFLVQLLLVFLFLNK